MLYRHSAWHRLGRGTGVEALATLDEELSWLRLVADLLPNDVFGAMEESYPVSRYTYAWRLRRVEFAEIPELVSHVAPDAAIQIALFSPVLTHLTELTEVDFADLSISGTIIVQWLSAPQVDQDRVMGVSHVNRITNDAGEVVQHAEYERVVDRAKRAILRHTTRVHRLRGQEFHFRVSKRWLAAHPTEWE